MLLALPLHTLAPTHCRYMVPLNPRVPLLFTLGRRLIISSAALSTSFILVSTEILVQSRLLRAVLSVAKLFMALVPVQTWGVGILRCLLEWLLAPFPVLLPLLLSHCRRVAVSTCRHKVKHHITAPLQVPGLVIPPLDDDCFYYHSWRNDVVIAFGTLSSFLT